MPSLAETTPSCACMCGCFGLNGSLTQRRLLCRCMSWTGGGGGRPGPRPDEVDLYRRDNVRLLPTTTVSNRDGDRRVQPGPRQRRGSARSGGGGGAVRGCDPTTLTGHMLVPSRAGCEPLGGRATEGSKGSTPTVAPHSSTSKCSLHPLYRRWSCFQRWVEALRDRNSSKQPCARTRVLSCMRHV
jgi:hypothetical protein